MAIVAAAPTTLMANTIWTTVIITVGAPPSPHQQIPHQSLRPARLCACTEPECFGRELWNHIGQVTDSRKAEAKIIITSDCTLEAEACHRFDLFRAALVKMEHLGCPLHSIL